MDDNEDDNERRDIRSDYPDTFEKLLKEEYGYTKGICYNKWYYANNIVMLTLFSFL